MSNKSNCKYHIVYQTTNLLNGMIYVGKRSTDDLNDGYLGSGTYLKSAIKKYGKHNFIRTILFMCESEQEAYDTESEIVTIDFVSREDTYNLRMGGLGAPKGQKQSKPHIKARAEAKRLRNAQDRERGIDHPIKGLTRSPETRAKMSAANKARGGHSDETRAKISNAMKGKPRSPRSPETVAKIANANRGRVNTPEAKARMSAARRATVAKKRGLLPYD